MPTRLILASLLVLAVASGCTAAAFDPTGPCTANGAAPGSYPDMEVLLPTEMGGAEPASLDSGRNCTQDALGTLWTDGLREVRFAGGVWKTGAESGVTLAIFRAPGLTARQVGTFYETGALGGRKTEDVRTATPIIDGGPAYRIDLTNGGYLQTVVVMPGEAVDDVRIVLVSSAAREVPDQAAHDEIVDNAVTTFVEGSAS